MPNNSAQFSLRHSDVKQQSRIICARRVVLFASLFFVALASGGAFVVYLAYNPAGMSQAFYVETMQHGIRVMLPLAVVLNLGLVFTIASAVLARRDRLSFYLLPRNAAGRIKSFTLGLAWRPHGSQDRNSKTLCTP